MKVKCPDCNVKMKSYQIREIFPDGGTMINLKCPVCSRKAVLSYLVEEDGDDEFGDEDIIESYNESQLANQQESQTILDDYLAENALSAAFLVANYAMRIFEIKPSLRFIGEDQILFEYPTPEAVFTVVFNLEGKSVEYVVSDPSGNVFPYYSLLSGCAGLHDVDFTTYTGVEEVCEQVDTYTSKFLIKELGGFR